MLFKLYISKLKKQNPKSFQDRKESFNHVGKLLRIFVQLSFSWVIAKKIMEDFDINTHVYKRLHSQHNHGSRQHTVWDNVSSLAWVPLVLLLLFCNCNLHKVYASPCILKFFELLKA